MSVQPSSFEIPEQTQLVAKAAFPKGNIYIEMRDSLGSIYSDEQFTSLFSNTGQPALSPWRMALITIMQFAENLSDRQAADAVRARIDWKYALSLELTDDGFVHTALTKFRKRFIENNENEILFDAMLQKLREQGLFDKVIKQRTDSTHIFAYIKRLNRIELTGATLQNALNALASAVPEWLRKKVPGAWFQRYSYPIDNFKLPKSEKKRLERVIQIGTDGHQLLSWILDEEPNHWLKKIEAVETLRLTWIQEFYLEEEKVYWRESKDLPPSAKILVSPHDQDARKGKKREVFWKGYKVHFTELCSKENPRLITNVKTTKAGEQDVSSLNEIHERLEQKGLLPEKHFVDQGYTSAKIMLESEKKYGVELVGPVPLNSSAQAREGKGFSQEDFTINFEKEMAICPMGKRNAVWRETVNRRMHPIVQVRFSKETCAECPERSKCTTGRNGRMLSIYQQEEHERIAIARTYQKTEEFKKEYAARSGVEGALSQAVYSMGMRTCRYRGLLKTNFQHLAVATAMNLKRAVSWLRGIPCASTRTSKFAELAVS